MSYGNFATCKKCGRQIIWVKTNTGKNMPCNPQLIDYVEVEGGRERIVRLDGAVVAAEIVNAARFDSDGVGYISHFATCPNGNEMRKRM